MNDFVNGKLKIDNVECDLFNSSSATQISILNFLSPEAKAVMDSARKLYRYYHAQPNVNVNASFYDIRAYFQGKDNGRMNNASKDSCYNELIADLRAQQKILAKKIESGVYRHEFLR